MAQICKEASENTVFKVYLIVNRVNGLKYVGATKNTLKYRLMCHFADSLKPHKNSPMCRAIREYGREAFDISLLGEYSSKEDMDLHEKKYIEQIGTKHPSGYNVFSGGGGRMEKGYLVHTEDSKKKMSRLARINNKGRKTSEATKEKLRISSKKAWEEGKMNNRALPGEGKPKARWADV